MVIVELDQNKNLKSER